MTKFNFIRFLPILSLLSLTACNYQMFNSLMGNSALTVSALPTPIPVNPLPTVSPTPTGPLTPSISAAPASPTGWLDSSGHAITAQVNISNASGHSLVCRWGLSSSISSVAFAACTGPASAGVMTISLTTPSGTAQATNGTMTFETKYSGQTTSVTQTFYANSSLNSVARCTHAATDTAIFTTAAQYASTSATFTNASVVANPFVNLVSTAGRTVSAMSLRHHFAIDPTKKMAVIYPNYISRTSGRCYMSQRHHSTRGTRVYSGDALVMMADGTTLFANISNTGVVSILHSSPFNESYLVNYFSGQKTTDFNEAQSNAAFIYLGN